ncbi:MAG TPA: hypothetical protein VIJ33_05390 [Solirubrobacteraceae bacterium]
MQPNGGVRARRRSDEQEKAEQDGPQGHAIGTARGALARAAPIDLDHPRAARVGDLAPDGHRASWLPGRRRRSWSLVKALRRVT